MIVFAVCIAAGDVAAQNEPVRKSDLVRLLGQLPEFSTLREDMQALGFRGEKLDLAVRQIDRMLKDPTIAGNIADRVLAAQKSTVSTVEAGGLFWPLVDRGLSHLDRAELRYFYVVEQTMLKALPARECGLIIKEKMEPRRLAQTTGRVASRLNTPALREYYRIQFKAAQLGAARAPKRLSQVVEAQTVETINAALGKALADRPDKDVLSRAYEDLTRVGNRRACTAGRVFMDAVLSLEGRDLQNALILLSTP